MCALSPLIGPEIALLPTIIVSLNACSKTAVFSSLYLYYYLWPVISLNCLTPCQFRNQTMFNFEQFFHHCCQLFIHFVSKAVSAIEQISLNRVSKHYVRRTLADTVPAVYS
jgi:hypothetical protein